MSQETLTWLNQNTLIGFTNRRKNAWHYRKSEQGAEPNHYPEAIPLADVQRRLFSWRAIELAIAVAEPATIESMTSLDDDGHPVRYVTLRDRKAIATSDTYDVLGLFKSGYQPHQYEDWLLNNVATILDDDLSISSAGLLRNRAVAWVEVSIPDNIITPEGVEFRPNLLATTSFDGSLATTFKRTVTAVVCDNTMGAALREQGHQVKFRHSRNSISRIGDARLALDIVHTMADDFASEVRILTSQTVTDAQWSKIMDELVPVNPDSKRAATMAASKREQLTELYRHDGRVAPWTGTAFGVLQAFSTWDHHLMPTHEGTIRAERNMLSALNGATETRAREVLAVLGTAAMDRSAAMGLESLA